MRDPDCGKPCKCLSDLGNRPNDIGEDAAGSECARQWNGKRHDIPAWLSRIIRYGVVQQWKDAAKVAACQQKVDLVLEPCDPIASYRHRSFEDLDSGIAATAVLPATVDVAVAAAS
jgi:hypothetical protein